MTLYAAHGGAMLTVPRVEAVRIDGDTIYARTSKRELFVLSRGDVFAASSEGAVVPFWDATLDYGHNPVGGMALR